MNPGARVAQLESELAQAQARIRMLEAALYPLQIAFPPVWDLRESEARVLSALAARDGCVPNTALRAMLPGDRIDPLRVAVDALRRKLKPYGITIERLRNQGYQLDPVSRFRVQGLAAAATIGVIQGVARDVFGHPAGVPS